MTEHAAARRMLRPDARQATADEDATARRGGDTVKKTVMFNHRIKGN